MSNQRLLSQGGLNKTRVNGVATEQVIKATPGYLHRIVLSNITAAATLTILDGATTLNVLQIGAPASAVIEIGAQFTSSIRVTPSNATVDALVVFD